MTHPALQSPNDTSVVLLAAGRGSRMMPLTADTPKPLLKVGGLSLIEHHLVALQAAGFRKVVINLAYRGDQIVQRLGDGSAFGVAIEYSDESSSGALETAGGLRKALPLIGSDYFVVINADIWTDYPFEQLLRFDPRETSPALGRLVMVDNPEHNTEGDFGFSNKLKLSAACRQKFTFSGIARYHRNLFANLAEGKQPLAPLFHALMETNDLDGELYQGNWLDVGTPERLDQLNQQVLSQL